MMSQLFWRVYEIFLRLRYGLLRDGFSIRSHLTVSERVRLYRLASRPGIRVCLEIGSYIGASAYFISAGLRDKQDGRLICIDTWNNDAMSEGFWDTYEAFKRNTSHFSNLIIPVRGFSSDVAERVAREAQGLDLLFIDGDHSYEGVKADWEAYRRFLNPGAIVVFHDWGWAEGVKRVVREDVEQLMSKSGTLPNMWWGQMRT